MFFVFDLPLPEPSAHITTKPQLAPQHMPRAAVLRAAITPNIGEHPWRTRPKLDFTGFRRVQVLLILRFCSFSIPLSRTFCQAERNMLATCQHSTNPAAHAALRRPVCGTARIPGGHADTWKSAESYAAGLPFFCFTIFVCFRSVQSWPKLLRT